MQTLSYIFAFITSLLLTIIPQKSYKEGMVGQPNSFLPNEAVTENDKTISQLLFRSLFKYDKNGDLVEDLADSYTLSDDGLIYTVYLKKDERWSNNSEITSDDLLYSAFTSDKLKEIATDKIDRYTIRYTLPNKFSPFISILTVGVTPAILHNNQLVPVSSGPYKVLRVKKEGPVIRQVTLLRVDEEFKLGRLDFNFYESEDELFTASKLGEIDGFTSSDEISWPSLNKTEYFQKGIYYSLIFNLRNPKFNNLEFRKKLVSSTPVKEIAEKNGIITRGPISESKYTKDDLEYNLFKPDFKENLNTQIVITLPNSKEHLKNGGVIKEAWKNLGIDVILNPVNPETIESTVLEKRAFEVLLYGQEVSRDPDRYSLWHSTRINYPGLNLSGFENVRLDRSLEEGRKFTSFDERVKHYQIFQDVIYENVPSVFLYHPRLRFYTNKRVMLPAVAPSIYYQHDRFLNLNEWDVI